MARTYIGLGSNLGRREFYLSEAISRMNDLGIAVIRKTGILETDPVEYTAQPRFLNQVVMAQTSLEPAALLETLLSIENDMGRTRGIPKGPRIIDLDILLYENLVMNTDRLVIPHPGICRRIFLLRHIVELDASLCDPVSGKPYIGILKSLETQR